MLTVQSKEACFTAGIVDRPHIAVLIPTYSKPKYPAGFDGVFLDEINLVRIIIFNCRLCISRDFIE